MSELATYRVGTLDAGAPGNGLNRAPSSGRSMRLPEFGLKESGSKTFLWKRNSVVPLGNEVIRKSEIEPVDVGAIGQLKDIGGVCECLSQRY